MNIGLPPVLLTAIENGAGGRMRKRVVRIISIMLLIAAAIILVGPLLIQVPPLEDTLPPEQLADPDSRFIDIHGVKVHYKEYGAGEPVLVFSVTGRCGVSASSSTTSRSAGFSA